MDKIKVMFLVSSYTIGGFETRLTLLVDQINKNKFKPTILLIYPFYKAKKLPKKVRERYRESFPWRKLSVETIEVVMNHRFDLSVLFKVVSQIRKSRVAILFFFALGIGTFIAPLAGKLAGVSTIVRASGTILDGLYPKMLRVLDRILLSMTDIVITPSLFLKKMMVNELKLSSGKVQVVPNGIDLDRFSHKYDVNSLKAEFGIPSKTPVVGMVANLVPLKAHYVLFYAIPYILKSFPNTLIVLVGEGHLRQELEVLAQRLGIYAHMRFLGYRRDVEKIIPLFDVGVLCSKVETFGNALVEIMASGVPVVASNVGAIPELIIHGRNGLLVPPDDSKHLAEAVVHLLRNKKLAQEYGRNGRRIAFEKFSKEAMVHQIESIFLSTRFNHE